MSMKLKLQVAMTLLGCISKRWDTDFFQLEMGKLKSQKNIEEGKRRRLSHLRRSPLAVKEIMRWYEGLVNDTIMLREVIELDATCSQELHKDSFSIEGGKGDFDEELSENENMDSEIEDIDENERHDNAS